MPAHTPTPLPDWLVVGASVLYVSTASGQRLSEVRTTVVTRVNQRAIEVEARVAGKPIALSRSVRLKVRPDMVEVDQYSGTWSVPTHALYRPGSPAAELVLARAAHINARNKVTRALRTLEETGSEAPAEELRSALVECNALVDALARAEADLTYQQGRQ